MNVEVNKYIYPNNSLMDNLILCATTGENGLLLKYISI